MSFPRYPEYKDSGVEWLGAVPAHWNVKRLKHNLRLLTEKTDRRANPVALENIEGWSGRFLPTETEFEGEGIAFNKGDILFGKLRPYLAKALLAEAAGEAVGDFHVMRPQAGVHARFAQYEILNRSFIDIVDGSTFGSKMPRASWEFVGSMPLPTPPYAEQTAIATFLDRETAKIDALVAEQEKLIALLQEKRQAVISHAVTKGLDPNAPMKDSGVEWLGEVPRHWQVSKISRFFQIKAGGDLKEEFFSAEKDEVHPYPIYTNSNKTGAVYGYTSAPFFDANTITVTGRGEVGFAVYRDCQYDAIIRLLVLSPKNGEYCKFAAYFINSAIVFFGGSTAVAQLSSEQISPYIIFDPPIEEKIKIVEFLDSESNKTERLIEQSVASITLLQERRTALISAAVTGQIDVRGLAGGANAPDLIASRAYAASA